MKTGLVLEGGSMRGLYTVGVLDCLLDHRLYFPYVIGVSAGAGNGVSYVTPVSYTHLDVYKRQGQHKEAQHCNYA